MSTAVPLARAMVVLRYLEVVPRTTSPLLTFRVMAAVLAPPKETAPAPFKAIVVAAVMSESMAKPIC